MSTVASTDLAAVIQKTPVENYVFDRLRQKSPFVASGAAALLDMPSIAMGGNSVTLPQWAPFTTADEVNDGTTVSTPAALATAKDIAVILKRKKVWSVSGVLKAALGAQNADLATRLVQAQLGDYIPLQMDNAFVSILTGLFDSSSGCLKDTHRNDISVASGTRKFASYAGLVDTMTKLGDNMGDLAVIVGHSFVWADLAKEQFSKCSEAMEMVPTIDPVTGADMMVPTLVQRYAGRQFIIADNVPITGSTTYKAYATFLLRPGSIAYAWQRAVELTVGIDATIPREIIAAEYAYAPHVHGTMWNTTIADGGPANATLATAADWAKGTNVPDKEIGVVALVSNASNAS